MTDFLSLRGRQPAAVYLVICFSSPIALMLLHSILYENLNTNQYRLNLFLLFILAILLDINYMYAIFGLRKKVKNVILFVVA
jgi:hypothetical protein